MSNSSKEYLKRKDVTAVYDGTRKKGGKDTGQPCAVVGVKKKKPLSELTSEEVLPSDVDVREINITLQQHRSRHRPVMGGVSGIIEGQTACTIGAIVVDNKTDKLVLLTNNHCVGILYNTEYDTPSVGFDKVEGFSFLQPSPYDGGNPNNDVIGKVIRAYPLNFGDDVPMNYVDAAIVSIDQLNDSWFSIIELDDGPFEFADDSDITNSTIVTKSGRTTGVTTGEIFATNMSVNVGMSSDSNDIVTFDRQIAIFGSGVSAGGDSGSVIAIEKNGKYYIAGLLFAGGTMDGHDVAICNYISEVVKYLNIRPWNGDIVLPHNAPETITINNVTFEEVSQTEYNLTHYVKT